MVRVVIRRRWSPGQLLLTVGLFLWLAIPGVWLALTIGMQATGSTIPGNPVTAIIELLLGHIRWPGGWATAFLVLEAAFLATLLWFAGQFMANRKRVG